MTIGGSSGFYFTVFDDLSGTFVNIWQPFSFIADSNWHYNCFDVYSAYINSQGAKYQRAQLKIHQAFFWPSINGMYIDSLSIRNTLPYGYPGKIILLSFLCGSNKKFFVLWKIYRSVIGHNSSLVPCPANSSEHFICSTHSKSSSQNFLPTKQLRV